jgi:Pyruvate/2-oxoacid:ferredoxin oxidoreductase gamma subunit
MAQKRLSITVAGSGGAGVMTVGNALLEAAGLTGWYAHMVRSSGPQIRGWRGRGDDLSVTRAHYLRACPLRSIAGDRLEKHRSIR